MVAACAETDAPDISAVAIGRIHLGVMGGSLLEASRDVFGMLFVALENLQAGLQQALQFRIARAGQRLPAKGNASMTMGPIFFSTLSRSMVRARCSRVFTVSGFNPSTVLLWVGCGKGKQVPVRLALFRT